MQVTPAPGVSENGTASQHEQYFQQRQHHPHPQHPQLQLQQPHQIRPAAVLVQDLQSCVPLGKILSERDLLYVLTPAAVPIESEETGQPPQDPFESFGRALATYHPWIRHIPYMVRDGITSNHASHLKLAAAVIFVITGPPCTGQPSQILFSQIVRQFTPDRPQIILNCCSLSDLGVSVADGLFPTLIEIPNYSHTQLEAAAELLFRPSAPPLLRYTQGEPAMALAASQMRWLVQEWDVSEIRAIHNLWCQVLPSQFHLDLPIFTNLLFRPGYSKHFVVRNSSTSELLGFCATFTTFRDKSDSSWIGSLAAIIVDERFWGCGIGTSLHSHALRQLREHRVSRLQLGSTFPRLLYGIPKGLPAEDWFRKRGWRIDSDSVPGCGQEACDWIINLKDWPNDERSPGELTFKRCESVDFDQVLEFVARESTRKDNVGFYDQYYQLAGTDYIEDILVGLEKGVIVATVLTYAPKSGSLVADNLPWASKIGSDVGGVACICIADDHITSMAQRNSAMLRVLDYCVRSHKERGMQRMFIDAIKGGHDGFQSTGFHIWARYRDVWREA